MSCGCSGTVSSAVTSCGCSDSFLSSMCCPKCGIRGITVKPVTVESQLRSDISASLNGSFDGFSFCANSSCNVVYYSGVGSQTFLQDDIKSKVTAKNDSPDTPLCYCKKLLKKDFYEMLEHNEENIADKIKAIISSGKSFCEKSNPKGVCCTEDVKIFLEKHGIEWSNGEKSGSCC